MAQLGERSLSIPELYSSSRVISKNLKIKIFTVKCCKEGNKGEKEVGIGPFLKAMMNEIGLQNVDVKSSVTRCLNYFKLFGHLQQ